MSIDSSQIKVYKQLGASPNPATDMLLGTDTSVVDNISGLIGHWPLDRVSDDNMTYDISGNGNNGLLVNMDSSCLLDGVKGKCLSFASGKYVDCGDSSILKTTGNRTFTIWIKLTATIFPDSTTNWYILANEYYNNFGFMWRIDGARRKQCFRTSQSGTNIYKFSNTPLNKDTWYFIAVVISGNTITMFLNGLIDGEGTINPEVMSQWNFRISNDDQSFVGMIDDFRFYNRALSSQEIQILYNNPGGIPWGLSNINLSVGRHKVYPVAIDLAGNISQVGDAYNIARLPCPMYASEPTDWYAGEMNNIYLGEIDVSV